jgi:hypothetical protein
LSVKIRWRETKVKELSVLHRLCKKANTTILRAFFRKSAIQKAFKSALKEIRAHLKKDVTQLIPYEIDLVLLQIKREFSI